MQPSEAPAEIGHNNPPSHTEILRTDFKDLMQEVDTLAAEATKLRGSLGEKVEITKEEQVEKIIDMAVRARKLANKVEETRKARNKPLQDEVSENNTFFNSVKTRMDKVKEAFEQIVGNWNEKQRELERRRAAEAAKLAEEEARRKLEEAAAASHSVESDVIINEAAVAERKAQVAASAAMKAGSGPLRTSAGTVSSSTKWSFHVEDWKKIDLRELRDSFTTADIEKAIRAHVRKHKNTQPLQGVKIFEEAATRLRG